MIKKSQNIQWTYIQYGQTDRQTKLEKQTTQTDIILEIWDCVFHYGRWQHVACVWMEFQYCTGGKINLQRYGRYK